MRFNAIRVRRYYWCKAGTARRRRNVESCCRGCRVGSTRHAGTIVQTETQPSQSISRPEQATGSSFCLSQLRFGAIIMNPSMPQMAIDSRTPSAATRSFQTFTCFVPARFSEEAASLGVGRSMAMSPLSRRIPSSPTSVSMPSSKLPSSGNRYDSGMSFWSRSSCMVSSVSRKRSLMRSGVVESPSATFWTRWAWISSRIQGTRRCAREIGSRSSRRETCFRSDTMRRSVFSSRP
ncbi:unnamed protein product [Pseudo-nitzschia multistriata]|uniref:Uncharacterized protein n=1 Tax=Pseudo-nitzschia multistriata TaxID=183589 RepID=A0A448ZP14_9STRA|nr:unnamed protein product [Pseudo-nitzschia multistriata]